MGLICMGRLTNCDRRTTRSKLKLKVSKELTFQLNVVAFCEIKKKLYMKYVCWSRFLNDNSCIVYLKQQSNDLL